jgi:RHS repeat-associated protein
MTVLLAALLAVAGTISAVRLLGHGGSAPAAQAGRPVAVRPVTRQDVKIAAARSWRQPPTSWPAAGTGTAVISQVSTSAFVQAIPGKREQVHEDVLLARTGTTATGTREVRPRNMPGGPTPGSARAGTTPVWVGPAATSVTETPVRHKTLADQARYPRYADHGRLASRPHDVLAPARPGSTRGATTSAAIPGTAVAGSVAPDASSPVSSAQVHVLAHRVAQTIGITGTVFTVARADGSALPGRVHVSFNYAGSQYAYGGDYASRLHLVELPACALTTPQVAACQKQTPVTSGDDVKTTQVGADVTLPGAPAGAVVLAVTASAQGSGGDYAAEPESEMKQWIAGPSSGAYDYTYPVTVPPAPGGFEPNASLEYDSQLTDGISAAANPQASEVGDGWGSPVPGYIEIDYQTCAANWAEPDILDLCDQVQEESLTQDGGTTPIVLGSNGTYEEEADNGSDVQQLSGGGWEITSSDGTRSYYGLDKLPGWTSGDPETNSIWTVPMWSGNEEETSAAPWRYMLDYVVDAKGNAIAYFYNTQTNYYATDGGSIANGAYTAGGVVAGVEYGLRDNGNIYAQTPAAEINYTYSASRQDAPTDLACASGAACSVNEPTFWTSDALTGITTESLVGSSLKPVDSYQLTQAYPATGDSTTSPSLWLASIQQTGEDGSTPVTLPPTQFSGTAMPNLDQTSSDKSNGYSLITRDRLTSITSDTGGVTSIAYTSEQSACSSGDFPTIWENAERCYPDYWYTNALADTDTVDWYNLYAVSQVTQTDTTGGNPPVVTAYTYGPPGWHYDNDDVSRSAYPTWDEWRGFQTVTTESGTSPDPATETVNTYYQGLSDDEGVYTVTNGQEGTGTVTLTTSRDISVTDDDQDAGELLETRVFDGVGGSEVSDTEYNVPAWSEETASETVDSALDLYADAYLTDNSGENGGSQTDSWTDLASGGSEETITSTSFNTSGDAISVDYDPWGAAQTCTSTSYVTNTSTHLTEDETVKVTDGSCSSPGTVVSDTEYAYDGGSFGDTPTEGLVTGTEQIGATASGGTVTTSATYDEYGRVLTSTDGDQRTATTAYTPATGAEPTSVTVTDPMTLATVTTYDPARELPLTVTTPGGYATTKTYDALGRITAEWTPGNPTSGNPQMTYSYAVSQTVPSVDITQTEEPAGTYLTTETLSDSLGREVETQDETASGGTDVTQTSYDSDGWKSLVSGPFYTSSAPSDTLVTASADTVPDETGYAYDGDGRAIKQVSYNAGTETWETDTSYGGNYTTVVPPTGGTSQTTFINGLNQTTAIYEYHAGVAASPSDPSSDYDQTSYTYTPAGKLATITDTAGNRWSYTYDGLGDQTTQSDPDAGTSTNTYDDAGQLVSVTDARGKTISYAYDLDGRKTAEYDTTGGALESSATELASWTYDTLAKGQLTSSTAYENGAQYTEEVTGYAANGQPSGTETIIPSSQGALAGTYTQAFTYAPSGQETSYTDSAVGGLPAETVTAGYNSAGDADSLAGASPYVDSLSYTDLDQPLQYVMNTSGEPVYITDTYDPQTGDLAQENTQTGTDQASIDDLNYSYNDVGDITSEADTPSANPSATDVQCFQYDYLNRLVQAWAQDTTGCVSTPSASAEGGAASYWESYSYNTIGNLTGITSTTPAGAVTTTTNAYPAAGAAQPHAITGQTITSATDTTSSDAYNQDGDLTTVTGSSQDQALTWNDAGQLTQDAVTSAGGTTQDTGYIYDADGNLLLEADPGTTTLYLSDEELSLNTTTGTVTGTRYYTIGGATLAALTSGSTGLYYLAGDRQNTESVAISASTLAVTDRYYDPYGNPIGTPVTGFPDGEKGFVGGTADAATGLTNLGAREFQPITGSFICPDPILDAYNPQDLNPYSYAQDSPATLSDPSGLASGWVVVGGYETAPGNWQTFPSTSGWAKWIENHIGIDIYFVEFSAHIYWRYTKEINIWRWFTSQGVATSNYKTQAIIDTFWWIHATYSVCFLFCYNGTQDLHYSTQQSFIRYTSGSPWNGDPSPIVQPNPPPGV